MAYEKIGFKSRDRLKAEHLNHIEEGIGQLSEEIADLKQSIVPDYWISELETKANDIQVAMETAGRNKSAFLWYTDAHWPNSAKVSPMLLDYLVRNTPMNKVNFGGDIVGDPSPYNHDNVKYVYDWRERIAGLPNHHSVYGNHDLNHWSTDVHKTAYAMLMAPEESCDMVVGGDSYYYIDNPSEKTRYLYLSYLTSDQAAMLEQGKFIVEVLNGTPEGWHIVAIAHRWWQYSSSSTPAVGSVPGFEKDVLSVFDAYNARETRSGSNYFYTQDFTNAKGKVEFCIGGHIHVDHDFTSDGGIPVIITASDTNQERVPAEPEDSGTAGTTTEAAVFGIIADYNDAESTKITVVGVGRGTSRVIGGDASDTPDKPSGNNLFDKNDTGVQLGVRWSNSSGDFVAGTTNLATGYIDAKVGDTFTLTSDLAQNANGYGGYAVFYDANKTCVGFLSQGATATGGWAWSDDYLRGTFTIPSTYGDVDLSGTAYVRFCVAYTNIDSIVITKNGGTSSEPSDPIPSSALLSLDRTYVSGTEGENLEDNLDVNKAYLNVQYGNGNFYAKSCTASAITENSLTVTEPGVGGITIAYPVYLADLANNAYKLSFDYTGSGSYKARAYWRGVYNSGDGGWGATNIACAAAGSGHIDVDIPASSMFDYIVFYFGSNTSGTATFTNVSLTKADAPSESSSLLNLNRTYASGDADSNISASHLDESKAYLNAYYNDGSFYAKSCTVSDVTENGATITEAGVGGITVAYPVHLTDIYSQAYKLTFDYSGTGKCRTYISYHKSDGTFMSRTALFVNDTAGASGSADVTIQPASAFVADTDIYWITIYLGSNTSGTKTYTNVTLTKA